MVLCCVWDQPRYMRAFSLRKALGTRLLWDVSFFGSGKNFDTLVYIRMKKDDLKMQDSELN